MFLISLVFPLFAAASPPVLAAPPTSVASAPLLRWGTGVGEIGFRPTARDYPGEGASSVAVGADGSVWVLDRLNRRVVGPAGRTLEVPADAVDLAIGADGTIATFSALKSRVQLFDVDGPAGELAVPRSLDVAGIAVGASRQVFVRTAYQETFSLGSPGAAQTEASILAHRREGAAFVGGRGVAVRRSDDGKLELLVQETKDRTVTVARHAVAGNALAGSVIGASGDTVCVLVETEEKGAALRVGRRVTCLDATSGAKVFETDLPAPGAYLPRRECAMGGSKLVHIHAEGSGLRVRSWTLPTGGVR